MLSPTDVSTLRDQKGNQGGFIIIREQQLHCNVFISVALITIKQIVKTILNIRRYTVTRKLSVSVVIL